MASPSATQMAPTTEATPASFNSLPFEIQEMIWEYISVVDARVVHVETRLRENPIIARVWSNKHIDDTTFFEFIPREDFAEYFGGGCEDGVYWGWPPRESIVNSHCRSPILLSICRSSRSYADRQYPRLFGNAVMQPATRFNPECDILSVDYKACTTSMDFNVWVADLWTDLDRITNLAVDFHDVLQLRPYILMLKRHLEFCVKMCPALRSLVVVHRPVDEYDYQYENQKEEVVRDLKFTVDMGTKNNEVFALVENSWWLKNNSAVDPVIRDVIRRFMEYNIGSSHIREVQLVTYGLVRHQAEEESPGDKFTRWNGRHRIRDRDEDLAEDEGW